MLLIATVVVSALIGVVATRGRLHPLAAAGSAVVGAGLTAQFLAGCALGASVVGENVPVQRVLAVGIIAGSGAATATIVAAVRGGAGSGDALLSELRSGTFRVGWWWPWLLLLPSLAVLVVFIYYPAMLTFDLATKLALRGNARTAERCLSNFSELMITSPVTVAAVPLLTIAFIAGMSLWQRRSTEGTTSHRIAVALAPLEFVAVLVALYLIFAPGSTGYREVYVATLVITTGTVALSMVLGLALAYLAVRRIRGAIVYRTLLIWPYAVSPPVAGILFFMMFDPTAGIVSHIFEIVGLDFPAYHASGPMAQFAVVLAATWKQLGYNILFYMAALQMVPRDLIEAAALDGASAWRRFLSIVVPTVAPVTFFLLVTNLTYAFFDIYGTIDYLTKGAPAGATNVAIYNIIEVANTSLGKGAAQSTILFLAVIGLTVWQFRRSEGRITYGGA